ncbi:MAG: tRNA 2-thiocytidine biosynthesis TtcA family protein [Malacoplasma sp.]|nr:tRNA 2-thiocytidine biosynthesis TtcA family protein [Malacoplasma sp.]
MRTCIGSIIRANKAFDVIENNDRIAVGVSGGKDSMLLLKALSIYKQILKSEKNWNIEIVGIHLKMNLCHIDYDPIIKYWKSLGIKFNVVETTMGEILRGQIKKGKIQCSLCSKLKKAILIDEAKKNNCNKVAMGHHADDAIETFFMNMINEGRIATFKPKMYLDRSDIWFIRPFIFAREKDIAKAAKKENMPIVPCGCPMEGFTQRDSMKDFLNNNFYKNKKWEISYKNFFHALINGKEFSLWFSDDKNKQIDLVEKIKKENY